MSDYVKDVRVRLLSVHDESGFAAAERWAKSFERELEKLEAQERKMASLQSAAAQEQIAREAAKSAAVVEANRKQGEAMTSFGRVAVASSVAVAVGLGLTAKAAMDWESSWAGVTKTVDGSPEQMARLEEQLRGLANVLPATHAEIAGVAEAAGQLGVKREDIAGFTKTMLDLGETTNLTADEAATALAQLMNVMGTAPEDIGRLGATIVALGNSGASTEADIVSMAQRIAGAGALVGASEGEVLALASALSSMGVTAELGGGVASRVLQDLYSAVQDGGDAVAGFAEVAGMSAAEFAAAFKADPVQALATFADGLNRVEANGGNVVTTLKDLGITSSEEQRIMLQLKANADLVSDSLAVQNSAWQENTALTDEANQRYATTEARLQMARNQINDAAIDIGANFLPALASAAEAAGSLATGFGALPPAAQEWVAGLGAAAVSLGALVGGAAIVIPKLKELGDTVTNLRGGSSLLGKGLGATAGILAGPWGLALAGAGIGLAYWLKVQGDAKKRVDEMTASLDEQTGAITESSRASSVKALSDAGAYDDAKTLGLALDVVTDAALGNADAQRQVNDAVSAVEERMQAAAQDQSLYTDELSRADGAANNLARSVLAENNVVADSKDKWEETQAAMGGASATAEKTATAVDALGNDIDTSTVSAEDAADAIDALAQALDDMNAPVLNSRDAQRAWFEQLEAVRKSVDENGTSLDITTEKGRANQEVIDGLAEAGAKRAAALLTETGSEEQFRASLDKSRQGLFDTARQFFDSEQATWDYVNSVLAVPPDVKTEVAFNTITADAQIQAFKDKWTGKNIATAWIDIRARDNLSAGMAAAGARLTAQANAYLNRPVTEADGSVLSFYGSGGVRENHVAQIAPAGAWRVWAEDETEGEAYIPLAQSKRGRSEAILEDVASRFGMYVGRYANGDVLGGRSVPTGSFAAGVSSLQGVRLTGTLDLGNGLTGLIDARVDEGLSSSARDASARRSSGRWS